MSEQDPLLESLSSNGNIDLFIPSDLVEQKQQPHRRKKNIFRYGSGDIDNSSHNIEKNNKSTTKKHLTSSSNWCFNCISSCFPCSCCSNLINRSIVGDSPILDGSVDDTIGFWEKVAYGFGEVPITLVATIEQVFLNAFLLEVAHISPFIVGTLLVVGQAWDAITDPIVGKLTDSTRTRWGRRRPWIIIGVIPLSLFFWCMWQIPPGLEDNMQSVRIVYFFFAIILYNTMHTALAVPYNALTPDLTREYDETTSLTMYRNVFSLLTMVFGSFFHATVIELFSTYRLGYLVSVSSLTPFIIIPGIITFLFTRERHYFSSIEAKSKDKIFIGCSGYFKELLACFKNIAFIIVTVFYICCWLSINLITNNLFLWTKYALKEESKFNYIILSTQVSALFSLFIWNRVSSWIGKKRTSLIGMIAFAFSLAGIFFIPEREFWLTLALTIPAGAGVGLASLLPFSMIPDVIDVDELKTGQRREGVYYSLFVLFQKLGLAIGLAGSTYALGVAGYEAPDDEEDSPEGTKYQPESVIFTLRILVSIVPIALISLGFIVLCFYPLSKTKHASIQAQIVEKRLGNSNSDSERDITSDLVYSENIPT